MPRNSRSPLTGTGITSLQYVDTYKKRQARDLRRNETPAEKVLWQHLRNRRIAGLKFRRQQIIEGFIADFYCEEARLVIEVDGSVHDIPSRKEKDAYRERVFKQRGLKTLRFTNDAILSSIEECILAIISAAGRGGTFVP